LGEFVERLFSEYSAGWEGVLTPDQFESFVDTVYKNVGLKLKDEDRDR
jgi:hypothetical protein